MNIIVTYQSKTGFTKKYAEWIAEELGCEAADIKKVTADRIAGCDLVIHGGWIMGGMINGLNQVRASQPKKLIVFGVGSTDKDKVDLAKYVEGNKLGDTPLYYYVGGMNPKKMGFFGRTMVKMVTKKKPEYEDRTNKADIGALVTFVREMS